LDPYFQIDGKKIIASPHCAGPWDPGMQHGGAVSGLIAHLVDTYPSKADLQVSRLTIDLKRPVPMGELDFDVEVTREGRNIQTLDIAISAGGKECVRASALRIREAEMDLPEDVAPPEWHAERAEQRDGRFMKGFNEHVSVFNADRKPDHVRRAAWFHIGRPYLPDQPTTPLMRAAATGDYCNGVGSGLDFLKWTYINADLTLHFARRPVGEWIMLAANAWVDKNGSGVAFGELCDEKGFFGRATQSLVIDKRQ
tara:strand:- start:53 stop:814 length:762 start_codon:yes stop_codon:yes gene_type:complete